MRVGNWETHLCSDGAFALDGGAMFGTVPKVLWEKSNPADAKNRIDMGLNCLLLVDPASGRAAIVDTGMGTKWDARGSERFKVCAGMLVTQCQRHGIAAEDITDVILTHLHFDHAGGTTWRDPENRLHLTFPRAIHHVQRDNFKTAIAPNDREKASYLADSWEPLLEHPEQLHFIDGDVEIIPGITARTSHGHTKALQCVLVEGGDSSVLYTADLCPTTSHLKIPWVMGYDLEPLRLMEEKAKLLGEAAKRGTVVIFEHDPKIPAARLKAEGRDFAVAEAVDLD